MDATIFMAHHGVKGMHWGVRRGSGHGSSVVTVHTSKHGKLKAEGGEGHAPHKDAIEAKSANQKAKKSGVHSLSNAELNQSINRMRLEQQFHQLNASSSHVAQGKAFVQNLVANTAKQEVSRRGNEAVKKKLAEMQK